MPTRALSVRPPALSLFGPARSLYARPGGRRVVRQRFVGGSAVRRGRGRGRRPRARHVIGSPLAVRRLRARALPPHCRRPSPYAPTPSQSALSPPNPRIARVRSNNATYPQKCPSERGRGPAPTSAGVTVTVIYPREIFYKTIPPSYRSHTNKCRHQRRYRKWRLRCVRSLKLPPTFDQSIRPDRFLSTAAQPPRSTYRAER
jgi:hypothetical protein